jgi:hypothetical protein
MRSSHVTLAASAAALLAAATFGAAPAMADSGWTRLTAPGTTVFDEAPPGAGDAPAPDARPQPAPLDAEAEGLAVGDTYGDVFRALKDDNSCSRFFGGPRVAVTVFNEFARRLRLKTLGVEYVGLVMTGSYTLYKDERSGALYRLFDEATINSSGPFSPAPPPSRARFKVGRFRAATRSARALMLLHELGHLIRGPDGWLLPNDGGDRALSDRNTRTVESRCIEQLHALRE